MSIKKNKQTLTDRIAVLEKNHEILLKTFTECNKGLTEEVKTVHGKIDKILNIRVNGRQGLEESLKDLYELTKSQRANKRLRKAFNDWIDSKPTFKKLYNSPFFKAVKWFTLLWLIFGILQLLGINITFGQLIDGIINFIKNFGTIF